MLFLTTDNTIASVIIFSFIYLFLFGPVCMKRQSPIDCFRYCVRVRLSPCGAVLCLVILMLWCLPEFTACKYWAYHHCWLSLSSYSGHCVRSFALVEHQQLCWSFWGLLDYSCGHDVFLPVVAVRNYGVFGIPDYLVKLYVFFSLCTWHHQQWNCCKNFWAFRRARQRVVLQRLNRGVVVFSDDAVFSISGMWRLETSCWRLIIILFVINISSYDITIHCEFVAQTTGAATVDIVIVAHSTPLSRRWCCCS
jgi:hypothetical protein